MKNLILSLAIIMGLSGFIVYQNYTTQQNRTPASSKKDGSWSFRFNTEDFKKNTETNFPDKEFTIEVSANDWESAYKKASKKCFDKLTGGQYPGEQRGLDIIDICSNPR